MIYNEYYKGNDYAKINDELKEYMKDHIIILNEIKVYLLKIKSEGTSFK